MKRNLNSSFEVFSRSCLLFHTRHFESLGSHLLRAYWEEDLLPGIHADDLGVLSTAASLHDIGKCALSEQVVDCPTDLSPLEYEIMKQHTTLGAMMIDKAGPEQLEEPFRAYARELALYHHERWDGSGYPAGLKGSEIPAYVQVISLADVYDALRTSRPYRPAFSHRKAVDMIFSGRCGGFDPRMLSLFSPIIEEAGKEIYGEGDL